MINCYAVSFFDIRRIRNDSLLTIDYIITESNTCTPELNLPFCGDLNDFSGKNTYIQEIGHVRLREGKAYFDGKSYLFIPRFTGIKYGDTVVIKLK